MERSNRKADIRSLRSIRISGLTADLQGIRMGLRFTAAYRAE